MLKIVPECSDGKYSLAQLLKIMEALRSPDGCPWDREQTHQSIRNDALEEVYEVVDAIDNNDAVALCEELGDMLLQVVFHSCIAAEQGNFNFEDVVDGVAKKLVHRHPHVFGDSSVENSSQVLDIWDKVKKEEKNQQSFADTLKSVPKAFPALMRAAKVQKRAKKAGVTITANVSECLDELIAARSTGNNETITQAYGKLLFAVTALQGDLKVNAEEALAAQTEGYISRFEEAEKNGNLKDF